MTYHITKTVTTPYEETIARVTKALAAEGFGILTTIDVKATLKKKIDADFRPYIILGACNPKLAHQALLAEDKVGTLLPCNVVVQERQDGVVEVSAMNPKAGLSLIGNPGVDEVGEQAYEHIVKALDAL